MSTAADHGHLKDDATLHDDAGAHNAPRTRTKTRSSALKAVSASLGGWIGLLIHKIAAQARRLTPRGSEVDSSSIAVMCDAFLRYGSRQAIGLAHAGLNVTLYYVDRLGAFGDSDRDRAVFLDRARAAGVDLVPLPRRNLWALPRQVWSLHRDLRRRRVGSIVAQSNIDLRYATLGLAFPVALILHDPQPHSGDTLSTFPWFIRIVPRWTELTASCLIIHSEQLLGQVRPLLRRLPIGVVPHGAEMALEPLPIPKERVVVLFGRLFAYKGVDTALDAFRRLPAHASDVRLVIGGRGPLAEAARGVDNVELRDEYISDGDMTQLLADARLVLLPYKDATQSGVGLDAVARGIPCVVSRVGGLPELVEDSASGLVVSPDDPEALAKAIVAYVDHEQLLRQAIYDHAATHFAWPVVALQLCDVLERIGISVTRTR